MKKTTKIFALAALPLIGIGTAAASIAFAAPVTPQATPTTVAPSSTSSSTSADTDVETNDDTTVSHGPTASNADSDTETVDDATGPNEAPGIEQAD